VQIAVHRGKQFLVAFQFPHRFDIGIADVSGTGPQGEVLHAYVCGVGSIGIGIFQFLQRPCRTEQFNHLGTLVL
jgi:hypothetical protein